MSQRLPSSYGQPAGPQAGPYIPPEYDYLPKMRRQQRRSMLMGCISGVVLFALVITLSSALGLGFYAANPPERINIMVLGVDARPDAEPEAIARTDSIMIVSLNPRDEQVSLLSIPRDLFIDSPRYGHLRANTVVRNAELQDPGSGIAAMQEALEYTLGIEIHQYARLSFNSFTETVDAVGGLKIDVPRRIVDETYPTMDYGVMRIEFSPGEQTMDGEQALIYARTRHGDDDYQRAERQQQVMVALLGKLANPLNIVRWPAVMSAISRNIETDLDLPAMLRAGPAVILYGRSSEQIESLVIDRDYLSRGADGEAVPNMAQLAPWLDAHLR